MQLKPGDRLGRYEIGALVGAGGMGEVYRARDPELEREVAIKVLPAELAEDPTRLRRFEREAKSIARLDHPNLLAIYDVGRHDGTLYLVCELLEGQTLGDRLASASITVPEALDYGVQVARGLAAAHEAGVIHRDLKPANLFLTADGRVKILDFGLAKEVAPSDGEDTARLTTVSEEGTLLGTVGYMAPEQVAGQRVDRRADQFALGIVLYEMLSGRSPFQRQTTPETLTAILRETPEPLAQIAPRVPAPLRWVVERCLARDPEDRYDSTNDLAKALETVRQRVSEIGGSPAAGIEASRSPKPGLSRTAAAGAIVLLAAVIGLVAFAVGRSRPAEPGIEYHQITFRRGTVTAARFDPGTDSVLYSAAWEGEPSRIHLARPQSPDAITVGPPDSKLLSVSEQGELLVLTDLSVAGPFQKMGKLARMPVSGTPRPLATDVTEAAFGPDGKLAAVAREVEGNTVLEFPPGTKRFSTRGMVLDLRLSPRGDRLAFAHSPSRGHEWGPITVLDRNGGETRLKPEAGRGLVWSPSGDELWFVAKPDQTHLQAVTLDGAVRQIATFPTKVSLYDIDLNGRVLLATETRRYEMAGRQSGGQGRDLTWLSWSVPFDVSADGQRVLFNECSDPRAFCRVAVRGFGPEAPVVLAQSGFGLQFSPDGESVISVPPWQPREATLLSVHTEARRTFSIRGLERIDTVRWLPDGRAILISGNAPGEGDRIFRMDLNGGAPDAVTPEGIEFGFFAVSPDGSSVAAPRMEGGIAIYPLAGGEPRTLNVDEQPIRWSADGESLYTAPLSTIPATIHRVDLDGGATQLIATLKPPDTAGVTQISPVIITRDGTTFVYGYVRNLSELFIVDGLR
jgi:hypothetical protein